MSSYFLFGKNDYNDDLGLLHNKLLYANELFSNNNIYLNNYNYKNFPRSIGSLNNNNQYNNLFENILQKANIMLNNNAYLYLYEKFGVERDELIKGMCKIDTIIHNYDNI